MDMDFFFISLKRVYFSQNFTVDKTEQLMNKMNNWKYCIVTVDGKCISVIVICLQIGYWVLNHNFESDNVQQNPFL